MRYLAATLLLAAIAAAQVPTPANSDPVSSTVSAPRDIPSHSGIPESGTAVSPAVDSKTGKTGDHKASTSATVTSGKASTTDFSALGCTQWTTIHETASPLRGVAHTVVDTTVQAENPASTPASSTVSSQPAQDTSSLVEPPHMPSETSTMQTHSTKPEHTSSHAKASSTDPVPTRPTEEPHLDLLTSSRKASSAHPIPTHPTEGPHSDLPTSSSSKAMLPPSPSSSRTWTTSTKKHTFSYNPLSTGSSNTHSQSMPAHSSKSHHDTQSVIHSNPPMTGGYTMTMDLTKTVHSTVTVRPITSTSHRSTTTTTIVVTVTAATSKKPHLTKSICEEKTVTTTTTEKIAVTKHQKAEPSQTYTLLSQLSDGQINGEPVPAHTKNDEQPKPSSLSLHGPPAEVTPRSSSSGKAHPTGIPHQPVPYGPEHSPVPFGSPPPHADGTGTGMTSSTKSTQHVGTKTRDPDHPHMTNPSETTTSTRSVDDTPNLSKFLSEMTEVPKPTPEMTSSKSTQHNSTTTRNIDDTPNLSEFLSQFTEVPEVNAGISFGGPKPGLEYTVSA